jgi:transposase
METPRPAIGIDVAKSTLTVAMSPDGPVWEVTNDDAGWQELIARLTAVDQPRIVLEASGRYELGVVLALDAAGMTPAVINPLAARRFVQSLGTRAKTDRIDALKLALFAARQQPTPQPVPAETARRLRALLDRHRQLTKMLVEEQNRAHQADPLIAPLIAAHLDQVRGERRTVAQLLEATIAQDPWWQRQVAVLTSVPGIATLTATVLLVGVPELGTASAKRIASLVGVGPHPQQSGRWVGQNLISGGRGWVRHILYQATMAVVRFDPVLRTHYQQLRQRGKPHKLAIIACMRRLLGILGIMCREHLTWRQTNVGQGQFLPPSLDT